MLRKNKIDSEQTYQLRQAIDSFSESQGYPPQDRPAVRYSILKNIAAGFEKKAVHDAWIWQDGNSYCLCKEEIDLDGSRVYTAYQLWIHPERRTLAQVRRLVRFLRFYAQKQKYDKLVVLSSRMDKIRAYARGLGRRFKLQSAIFVDEF